MAVQIYDVQQSEDELALVVEPNTATRSALSQAFEALGVRAEPCVDLRHCVATLEQPLSVGERVVAILVAAQEALSSSPSLLELLPNRLLTPPIIMTKPATLAGLADKALRHAFFRVLPESPSPEQARESVSAAIEEGRRRAGARRIVSDFREREASLSREEREVLEAVCEGKLNKQIAREQAVSVRTVEQRRRRVFRKMGVASAAPLAERVAVVRTLSRLHGLKGPHPARSRQASQAEQDGWFRA